MMRTALLLVAWLVLAPASAQEGEAPEAGTATETEQPAEEPAATDDERELPEVDDESYLDIEEDDFRPSEEIPTDQSISFPTDI